MSSFCGQIFLDFFYFCIESNWNYQGMQSNDYTLWEDFIKGEQYALTQIYEENIDRLFNYGLKLIPDKELVKDNIQDLFCDLIRTRSNLNSTYNIQYYLMLSLRRKLFRNHKKNIMHSEFDDELLDSLHDSTNTIEENLIHTEVENQKKSTLKQYVSKLTRKQKEILYYKFECEFDYEKICQLMSINYDSARKLLFRTLKTLREQLTK